MFTYKLYALNSLPFAKSQPHNKQEWSSSLKNDTPKQINTNLKKVRPMFFKYTRTPILPIHFSVF